MMKFANAHLFYFFWVLVLPVVFLWWRNKVKCKKMRTFVDHSLIEKISVHYEARMGVWRIYLMAGVLILSLIALARPQWGFEWQEIKQEGVDLLVMVDVSKSMLTQDVKPNRLERTKLAIQDLLAQLKGDRIGLIAFAGDSFLLCPLTVDYNGFQLSINDLNTKSIASGGTNISQALYTAIKSYEDIPSKNKAIIIVTDGDNLVGDPLKAAQLAKEKKIRIYTVGVGTKEGELIRIKGKDGVSEFLKNRNGKIVRSQLNENLLSEIARATGGAYFRASSVEFGLDILYEKVISKLETRKVEARMEKKFYERFQWPLALAFLLLMLETCLISSNKSN